MFGSIDRVTFVRAVVATALLLAVGGCSSGNPSPNYSSARPTSASPSASTPSSGSPVVPTTGPNVRPGEVPPTPDPVASENSAEGAQAFVAYYVRAIDWAYATSSPDFLRSYYATNCNNCVAFLDNVKEKTDQRYYYTGSRIRLNQVALVHNDNRMNAAYAVSAENAVSAGAVHAPNGRVISDFPAVDHFTLTTWLGYENGKWVILDQGKA